MKLQAIDSAGVIQSLEIDLSKKIGEGATATVYKVAFKNELWAAKIYKSDRKIFTDKLDAMLRSPPAGVLIKEADHTFIQYTWVNYLLKDVTGNLVGFLMHFVDQNSTNALDTYYDPVLIKRLPNKLNTALSLKIEIARNLCDLIDRLHVAKHYFIDIKPQNIRVYRDNNKVVLMDCDGYSIKNNNFTPDRFPADLISTDFIAPEVLRYNLLPSSLSEEQDRYGLAVLLFQLLNRGTHPFQGIVVNPNIKVTTNDERASLGLYPYGIISHPSVKPRPQSVHHLLLEETRILFDQAFTQLDRPSAKDWKNHFQSILDSKKLVRCSNYPNDINHIHFSGKGCIGCKISELDKNKEQQPARSYSSLSGNTNQSTNSVTSQIKANIPAGHQSNIPPKSNNNIAKIFFLVLLVVFVIPILLIAISDQNDSGVHSVDAKGTPNTNKANEVGFVSVFISDYYGGGWYAGGNSRREAEVAAKDNCIKYSKSQNCTRWFTHQAACIGISRDSTGIFGGASGPESVSVGRAAVEDCRKKGGIDCTLVSTLCEE